MSARRGSTYARAGSSAWARRAPTASASSTRWRPCCGIPESVPVNALVPVKGTVLGDMLADTPLAKIDDIEFVRTVATARITMPRSMVRLSAGRETMSEATQALCFLAGANSIFTGDKLLTAPNAGDDADGALFAKLGLGPFPRARSRCGRRVRSRRRGGSTSLVIPRTWNPSVSRW